MIEVALGALLGLGLFVIVSGATSSRVAIRLAPHIRDVAIAGTPIDERNGALRSLGLVFRLPASVINDMVNFIFCEPIADKLNHHFLFIGF
jgi:hypothetical protein